MTLSMKNTIGKNEVEEMSIENLLSMEDDPDEILALMELLWNEELEQKINDNYKAWMNIK